MFHMRVEGLSELKSKLDQYSKRVSKQMQRNALLVAVEPARRAIANWAPVEPGKPDLRDTIISSAVRGEDSDVVSVAVGPSKSGYYGSFQELGTSRHAAQPFVRPGFDETVTEVAESIADELRTELDFR